MALKTYKATNVGTKNVFESNEHSTGVAAILLDKESGNNAISVVPGAAGALTIDDINNIKETFKHSITEILSETLEHEKTAIKHYYELLDLVDEKSVYLEEYARQMIGEEELHVLEVEKMLKTN